jgi:hypothetical protein
MTTTTVKYVADIVHKVDGEVSEEQLKMLTYDAANEMWKDESLEQSIAFFSNTDSWISYRLTEVAECTTFEKFRETNGTVTHRSTVVTTRKTVREVTADRSQSPAVINVIIG